jgi:hypothetical protein
MPQNPIPIATTLTPGKVSGIPQMDTQKAAWNADRHGQYYESSYLGLTAFAANPVGKITTVGLATTYTGLCVSNPAASTVNLVMQNVRGAFTVVTGAITTVGLITGYAAAGVVTHTTALTVYSTKIGSVITTPIIQGLADSACTLVGTPVWSGWLATVESGAVAGSYFNVNLQGEYIIPPGGYMAIGTTVASGAAGLFGSFTWEEVPI